ncbi:NACHT, LRR and PYD domains-containing 14-like [Paramuricea clavata]|uniref:NACHT, LRR and PYD domains-containing 14-like n=1 Tax=Paramuricea clavata TaxID=317549 RepID=A0A7D9D5Z4_PARCT|nr:NACHT, LRR and PYD domains-containing 14-like [Paramuricea clavata]
MESCLKSLPRKSYNTFGVVFITSFVSIGIVLIGIASDFESKATLQCNPDKSLASDLSTRKFIDTQCFLKYAQEFLPSLPLHVLFVINFGLVLLLSIIYAYSVKHRVEIFADPPNATSDGAEDESQPLSGISQAASDPMAYQNSGRPIVFTVYIMHLILCRIIPLVAFAALLLTSSNFPVQFHCPWPIQTISVSDANFTESQTTNHSIVDCSFPMGSKNEKLVSTVLTANILFGTATSMKLAYLLWSTWKDRTLCTDMEFCCVYLLRKRKRIKNVIKKIREKIPDDFFRLHDDFGEKRLSRRKLEEMAVNVIVQGGREGTWTSSRTFENRHETYQAHFIAPADATILTITADLFKPKYVYEQRRPKAILVVGRPGETSLREMLRRSDGLNMSSADFNYMYEYMCLFPSNVILVFDGLDELKVNYQPLPEEKTVNSHNEVTHILQIFKQLVKGTLLPGVTVLTTSRPTAEQIYVYLEFDREVEILGFHEEQIKDYVERFCRHDIQKSSEIWHLIKESPELLSLCYIPVNSYIVCLTLKESIGVDKQEEVVGQRNVPRTITEFYKRAIKILLFRHNLKYKDKPIPKDYIIAELPEQLQNDLDKLKGIARDGMINDQLVFEFENSDEVVAELSDSGVVDDMENVESFLSEHFIDPKWHLVIQFVAGLIGDKIRELKEERNRSKRSTELTNNNEKIIKRICERFQDWLPQEREIRQICRYDNTFLFVIKCVHEMQEVCVMELIASFTPDNDGEQSENFLMDALNISPIESTAVFEFLSYIKNLNTLVIHNCNMEHFAFRELAKLLIKDNNISLLMIQHAQITDIKHAKPIFDAFSNEKCKLPKLSMGLNSLTDEGAKYLSDALKRGNCKLTQLDIFSNALTDEAAKYLSDALKSSNCKLTQLNTGFNQLNDEGAKYLSAALKSGNCKLTELSINHNELKDEGAKYLSDSLKSGICKLTQLNVSGNEFTDEGAKYLSDALKSATCKLTQLDIYAIGLTDEGAKYLSDALKSGNCELTQLNTSFNNLADEGAKYLSDALKSGNCKLTRLSISRNRLTNEGAKYLSDALKSGNCKLTQLYTTSNNLADEGAKYLSDALKSGNCKLTQLPLSSSRLTDVGAKYLSDALKSGNWKLTQLNISNNRVTDEGAKYLSDALVKSGNCKLTQLCTDGNELTGECAKYLSDALKSGNCKLTRLDISSNRLTDEGAKYLSDALKSGNCKLTRLNISKNILTDEGAKYLSDALKSGNCELTQLDISENKLTYEGVKYLSDVLKSGNSKLTQLYTKLRENLT